MGAHNIDFELKGKQDKTKVNKEFANIRGDNRSENGHREGYSGDFQTVDSVDFHLHKTFNNYQEAYDYCMEHAEKWCTVVAVYYKNVKTKTTKLEKMHAKIKVQQTNTMKLTEQFTEAVKNGVSKKIACKNCSSSFKRGFVKYSRYGADCPVCNQSLFSATQKLRIYKSKEKETQLLEKYKAEKNKLAEKCKDINTLVAGWGAC